MVSDKIQYVTNEYYPVDVIEQCQATIEKNMSGFAGFVSNEEQFGESKNLRRLPSVADALDGILFTRLYVVGIVKTSEARSLVEETETFEQFNRNGAYFTISAYVQESDGYKQTPTRADRIMAQFSPSQLWLGYFASGSQVARDTEYAATFFDKFVSMADLPVIVRRQGSQYFLDVNESILLFRQGAGLQGENPRGMKCPLPSAATASDLVEKFKNVIEACPAKVFRFEWSMGIGDSGESPTQVVAAYRTLMESDLPADKYETLTWALRLNTLAGLNVLLHWLPPGGSLNTRICSFDLPDGNYGSLYAITTAGAEGHKLELRLTSPVYKDDIEKLLRINFFS